MMMKISFYPLFTFALGLVLLRVQAQPAKDNTFNYQCIYRLTYQPDSTNKRSRDSADMMLLLNKDNSLFADIHSLLRDTLLYYRYKNNIATSSKEMAIFIRSPKFGYYLSKNENGQILMNDKGQGFDFTFHRYEENRNIFEWELSSDADTISTIPCQKATCYFGKRLWTAWFAPSIPISDGPYKFCGLPGLIIKIADDKNYWSFTLMKLVNKPFSYHFYSNDPLNYEIKHTTKLAYLKAKRDHLDNLFLIDKQSGVSFKDGDEALRKMDEKMAKSNNNWIEIFP